MYLVNKEIREEKKVAEYEKKYKEDSYSKYKQLNNMPEQIRRVVFNMDSEDHFYVDDYSRHHFQNVYP